MVNSPSPSRLMFRELRQEKAQEWNHQGLTRENKMHQAPFLCELRKANVTLGALRKFLEHSWIEFFDYLLGTAPDR